MDYRPFHVSRIGVSHIKKELPCQDASASISCNGAVIAVVADGHGSRRHFRSDRGSKLACSVAIDRIRAFLDEYKQEEIFSEERLNNLKNDICSTWTMAVREDYANAPWTEEELEEQRALLSDEQYELLESGAWPDVAYGSTICAAFITDEGWAALQLGDGAIVHIGTDGTYNWPMPESLINEGNKTASLCMREPMRDFRHCYGQDKPAAILAYTDGIEKVFPSQGKEVVSLLHWIWRNEYTEDRVREKNLINTLDMLTNRSPIGDDLSVAGLIDPEAEDTKPVQGKVQQKQELDRLYARLAETESTITYYRQQIRQNDRQHCSAEVKAQLESVLQRNRSIAMDLHDRINEIRLAMDMEPEPFAEETSSLDRETIFDMQSGCDDINGECSEYDQDNRTTQLNTMESYAPKNSDGAIRTIKNIFDLLGNMFTEE